MSEIKTKKAPSMPIAASKFGKPLGLRPTEAFKPKASATGPQVKATFNPSTFKTQHKG